MSIKGTFLKIHETGRRTKIALLIATLYPVFCIFLFVTVAIGAVSFGIIHDIKNAKVTQAKNVPSQTDDDSVTAEKKSQEKEYKNPEPQSKNPEKFDKSFFYIFLPLFLMMMSTAFFNFALIVIYLVNVFHNPMVASDKKALWAVVLFFAGLVAMPVYWYIYIWKWSPTQMVPAPSETTV